MGDQKFPSVDAVFPELAETPTIGLNAEYLSTILSALSCEGYSLNFWATAPDKVMTIASESGNAVAVVMPMRTAPDAKKVSQRGALLIEEALAARKGNAK